MQGALFHLLERAMKIVLATVEIVQSYYAARAWEYIGRNYARRCAQLKCQKE